MPLSDSQMAEVEALEAIFGPALELKAEDDAVEILLLPEIELGVDAEANAVGLRLRITLPSDYPEGGGCPEVTPVFKKNIGEYRWKEIQQIIDQVIESHKGFEMLFDLYSAVTEWLQNNNEPELSLLDQMMKQKGKTTDETKFETSHEDVGDTDGDQIKGLADKDLVAAEFRVTEEEFMKWRDGFKARMIAAGTWKDLTAESTRPSGKELFLMGKGLMPTAETDAEGTGETKGQVFWDKAELYADEDVDLDAWDDDDLDA